MKETFQRVHFAGFRSAAVNNFVNCTNFAEFSNLCERKFSRHVNKHLQSLPHVFGEPKVMALLTYRWLNRASNIK